MAAFDDNFGPHWFTLHLSVEGDIDALLEWILVMVVDVLGVNDVTWMLMNVLGVWQMTRTTTTPVRRPDMARSLLKQENLQSSSFPSSPSRTKTVKMHLRSLKKYKTNAMEKLYRNCVSFEILDFSYSKSHKFIFISLELEIVQF